MEPSHSYTEMVNRREEAHRLGLLQKQTMIELAKQQSAYYKSKATFWSFVNVTFIIGFLVLMLKSLAALW